MGVYLRTLRATDSGRLPLIPRDDWLAAVRAALAAAGVSRPVTVTAWPAVVTPMPDDGRLRLRRGQRSPPPVADSPAVSVGVVTAYPVDTPAGIARRGRDGH